METEETRKEVSGLRSFAMIAFILLIIVGALSLIGGFILFAAGGANGASVGLTGVLTGALVVLAAFGVRYLLVVFADMAEDVRASRTLLTQIANSSQRPVSSPSVQQAQRTAAQARTAAPATRTTTAGRPPMPPARGTAAHPPMPPMRPKQ